MERTTTAEPIERRRASIALALRKVRRRNHLAAIGLIFSSACVFAGVGMLWWWNSKQSNDPVALRLQSPFKLEFQNPILFEREGSPGNAVANDGAGRPADLRGGADTGAPAK